MTEKVEINRSKTAVIIMDYQIRILDYLPKEQLPELLKRANIVLAKARQKGVPIIYVEVLRGERTPEMEIHPDIKIIIVSSYLDQSNITKAKELGAYKCISKNSKLFQVLDQIFEAI